LLFSLLSLPSEGAYGLFFRLTTLQVHTPSKRQREESIFADPTWEARAGKKKKAARQVADSPLASSD
jgi:hypothetical protein